MTTCALVFPNQLFLENPVLRESPERVLLVEDSLFFGDSRYPASFHKQKLAYHRATMLSYSAWLKKKKLDVEIVSYKSAESSLKTLCQEAADAGCTRLVVAELNDFMLQKRLRSAANDVGLELSELGTPGFINTQNENVDFRDGRKRWFMADFYQWQRKRLEILMDGDEPEGGKWSFDEENRKKLPKAQISSLPELPQIRRTPTIKQAIDSVEEQFADNPGSLDNWFYPTTHSQAEQWLDTFFSERFENFGAYEDAIVAGHNWLHHSILTPMLNTGLLTPQQIVDMALKAAKKHKVPLNSLEGFVRQIIGWREFMRATYHDLGVPMRTTNNWKHTRSMPEQFYTGTTGIDPIDDTILRILDTGYCHHIERLMVLGGFMFLCEIEPDDIYKWFMEMFIDSYDWVMVPNVYAMSQHADGGSITTKPYFSGSNYVIKMSHYKKGEWSEIWDGLFWRWIIRNKKELAGNRRWSMMVSNANKMSEEKSDNHLKVAANYLRSLSAS